MNPSELRGRFSMSAQHDSRSDQASRAWELSARGRRPYQEPRLCSYGDVSAITHTVGMAGNKDGGSGNTQKTH